jgi:hypothetical protein
LGKQQARVHLHQGQQQHHMALSAKQQQQLVQVGLEAEMEAV